MKKPTKHADVSVPQSVTDFIQIQTAEKSIKIGFTDQKISPHAGLSGFAAFLHWHRFKSVLSRALPMRTSPNATSTADLALGFMVGILAGAKKLAHVAYLRRDVLLPGLFGLLRFGSQSALSRFFKVFRTAEQNNVCFDGLWRWCVERLSSRSGGYTLDLDTTTLLHEDAHGKEGVRTGHTPEGRRRCYHPLLGMIAEVKLVIGLWLRPGNTRSDNNAVAFTMEILRRLPSYIRIGLVRADSGFCDERWLSLLEQRALSYIVVGRIYHPVHRLIRKTTLWMKTDLAGTEVAEEIYDGWNWSRARRIVLIRHREDQRPDAGGRLLVDCPGYKHQVLVTNLPTTVSGIEVWRRYNGRADSENVIKELDASFALPQICLEKFYATEAALILAVLSYNLCILFQRHLGWTERITAATLRFRLFTTGGVTSQSGGYHTIRLAVGSHTLRDWWRRLLDKIICPFRNCVAVEAYPDSAGSTK
jgi:Transposase DDE domain group 1